MPNLCDALVRLVWQSARVPEVPQGIGRRLVTVQRSVSHAHVAALQAREVANAMIEKSVVLANQMTERGYEVAAELLGSCDDLSAHCTEVERDNPQFCAALDDDVMLCELCGWWVDSSEVDEDGNCHECAEDLEE